MAAVFAPGFIDPVRQGQATFRAVMIALSRPGLVGDLPCGVPGPAPLSADMTAVLLTLADHETTVWLDEALSCAADVAPYIGFRTGAAVTGDPRRATFALVSDPRACPAFESFAQGTPEYPDRSTTLIVAVDRLGAGRDIVLEGPGIRGRAGFSAPSLPADFVLRWAENHRLFPLGIDCILVGGGRVVGLPRSSRPVFDDATMREVV